MILIIMTNKVMNLKELAYEFTAGEVWDVLKCVLGTWFEYI